MRLGPETAARMLEAMRHRAEIATPTLNAFLDDQLARHGLEERQLALVGFSQGTMMALYVAPRRPRPCAAVVGYSGALLGAETLPTEATSRPPVLLIHGDADEVVPVQALDLAVRGLQGADIPVRWRVHPGLPHAVDPEGIQCGADFLRATFEETGG
jgi:phospholipase/carboxylesterase